MPTAQTNPEPAATAAAMAGAAPRGPRAFDPAPPPLRPSAHAAVLALLATATAFMTWPLVRHPTTHLLGSFGDSLTFLWNMAWARHALLELHQWPFFGDFVFRPFEVAFMHHSHTYYYGFIYTLGSLVYANPIFWINVIIFISFMLAGYGTFLLARRLSGDTGGALLAAVAFAFCSYRLLRAQGHLNLLSNEYLPWYLYCLISGMHHSDPRRALRWFLGAALCFVVTFWNEYYNAFFALLLTAVVLTYYASAERPGWRAAAPRLARAIPAMAVAALLLAPYIHGLWYTWTHIPLADYGGVTTMHARAVAYLLPSASHRLFGPALVDDYRRLFPTNAAEATVFPGLVALILALYGAVRIGRPRPHGQRLFLWIAFIFFVLSLGPAYYYYAEGRRIEIPLPFAVFTWFKGLRDFRVSARFGLVVILACAVLAAYGWREFRRLSGLGARGAALGTALLIALSLFENLLAPLYSYNAWDLHEFPRRWVERLRRDPDPGLVLQLPFAIIDYRSQWLQTWHNKPMLTGALSRVTKNREIYYQNLNLHGWLLPDPAATRDGLGWLNPPFGEWVLDPRQYRFMPWVPWTRESVAPLLAFFDMRWILIPEIGLGTDLAARLRRELLPIEHEERAGRAALITLRRGPVLPIAIHSESPTDNFYFMEGFTTPGRPGADETPPGQRWAWGDRSVIAFRLDRPEPLRLTLDLAHLPFVGPDQRVTVGLNHHPIVRLTLAPTGWTRLDTKLPVARLRAGYNYLEFHATRAAARKGNPEHPYTFRIGPGRIEPSDLSRAKKKPPVE